MASDYNKCFSAIQQDLHKLCWMEPFQNPRDGFDPGWNCRDQAVILAYLARMMGTELRIVHGSYIFVQGPKDTLPSVAFGDERVGKNSHTWLEDSQDRIIDLSPNLSFRSKVWRPVDFHGVLENVIQSSVSATVYRCTSEREYEHVLSSATHQTNGALTCLYHPRTQWTVGKSLLEEPVRWINSPLTDDLKRLKDPELHAKAVLYLASVALGECRSIAGLSQRKAWNIVSEQPAGATRRLIELCKFSSVDGVAEEPS